MEIKVPDLGDFEDVEVIEILVAEGDTVSKEDGLITLETDKAAMDVPAPEDGRIATLSVEVGDRVSTGDVIGQLESGGGAGASDDDDAGQDAEADTNDAADRETDPEAATKSNGETAAGDDDDSSGRDADSAGDGGGSTTVSVPDMGDFAEVEVIEILVAAGDTVAVDDPLITLETDKAAMDVPSTAAGTVEKVLVETGAKVSEGTEVAVIATSGAAEPAAAKSEPDAKAPATSAAKDKAPAAPQRSSGRPADTPAASAAKPATLPPIDEAGFSKAHAGPSVRKLARELGVNLTEVRATGPKQRILHEDVKSFVKAILEGNARASTAPSLPQVPTIDFSKFGDVESKPLTRIQRISGPRLQASWINLPHVTQHDLADITDLEARRQVLKGPAKERGISLTPLAFVMKACIAALKEFPKANSSLSADGESLVFKQYYHLGFAADTDGGLVVPVIRDADRMDVYELATALGELSQAARDGKLKAEQMQGATFTVSSLGGIGGTAFTPIVNAPEVAILGVSRSAMQPVWNGEEFEPRLMLPLSLSYDHRVIDGADAVRFTTFLGQVLADVDKLLQAIP